MLSHGSHGEAVLKHGMCAEEVELHSIITISCKTRAYLETSSENSWASMLTDVVVYWGDVAI
jgi:hypothetical protein